MRLAPFLAAAVLVSSALASVVRAETHDDETVALAYQTEHADAVLVADLDSVTDDGALGGREITFSVRETLRGDAATDARVVVVFPDLGHGTPWREGARHLLFLRRLDVPAGVATRYEPVTGTLSFFVLPADGPENRMPGMVRELVSMLGRGTTVARPDALRQLLVRWMEDDEPGVVWSAATDFVHHERLHGALTEQEGKRIVEAYRRHPVGKRSKHALALATAATRHAHAGRALVDSLLGPDASQIRGMVCDALARLDDPAVPALLHAALRVAPPERRPWLVTAIGSVGVEPSVSVVKPLLIDPSRQVRVEAAHALGRIARRVRERDSEDRIAAHGALHAFALTARTKNEQKASLWALAQLDAPDAYAILRKLATHDVRPDVRRFARRYLDRPRLSLILR